MKNLHMVVAISIAMVGCNERAAKAPSPNAESRQATPAKPNNPITNVNVAPAAVNADVADRFLAKGIEQYGHGEDHEAVESFKAAIDADPNRSRAYAWRGLARAADAYYAFAQQPRGSRCKDGAVPCYWILDGNHADPDRSKVAAAFKAALADVEKGVELDKVDELAWVCRGVVYLWRADLFGPANLERARADLSQAILLKPDCMDAHYYRSWAWYKSAFAAPGAEALRRAAPFGDPRPAFSGPAIGWYRLDESKEALDALRNAQSHWEKVQSAEKGFLVLRAGSVQSEASDSDSFRNPHYPLTILPALFTEIRTDEMMNRGVGARPLDPKEVFAKAKDSVVLLRVKTADGTALGTGFVIAHEGKPILTNAHVVAGAVNGQVEVQMFDGRTGVGRVARTDTKRDLALVEVPDSLARPSLWIDHPANGPAYSPGNFWSTEVGEKVVAIGHPQGLEWSMTSGIVSAIRKLHGVEHMQTDTALTHGNSGGPVLDLRGRIVGVVKGGSDEVAGLNFAITAEEIRRFVYSH